MKLKNNHYNALSKKLTHYDILISPISTEKTNILSGKNKYTFKVHKLADKSSIKEAVEKIFDVKVKSVNIVNVLGKVKSRNGRPYKRSDAKKAIVSLSEGYSINLENDNE